MGQGWLVLLCLCRDLVSLTFISLRQNRLKISQFSPHQSFCPWCHERGRFAPNIQIRKQTPVRVAYISSYISNTVCNHLAATTDFPLIWLEVVGVWDLERSNTDYRCLFWGWIMYSFSKWCYLDRQDHFNLIQGKRPICFFLSDLLVGWCCLSSLLINCNTALL